MARLIPDDVAERNQGPWPDSEHATLNRLAVALSAEYTAFHGIHWARIDRADPVYGEIDFIVMNRHGRLLAIEQKDAPVTVVRNELMVHYRSKPKPKSVLTQVARNLNGLRSTFERSHPGRSLTVDHLFYLPESHLSGQLPAGVDASRVVDASNAGELVSIIEGLFEANPMPQGEHPADPVDILNFLSQRLQGPVITQTLTGKAPPPWSLSAEQQGHFERLSELCERDSRGFTKRLMLVEIFRQLRCFDKAH